jgi:putative phosphoribosyl transferase
MTGLHSTNSPIENIVRIPVEAASNKVVATTILEGSLTIPNNWNITKGIIVFAHGSSSGRHSPRNEYVAKALNKDGLATLLIDLLTKEEEETDTRTEKIRCKIPGLILNKFNVKLLSDRLLGITDWLVTTKQFETHNVIIGYFGASTGAAAGLIAAAQRVKLVGAVVCRSGRPDLVSADLLTKVRAPTLLIVGGNDHKEVIDMNNNTLKQLLNVQKKKVAVVPGATHLFEDREALENLARLASGWFRCYFLIMQRDTQEKSTKNSVS